MSLKISALVKKNSFKWKLVEIETFKHKLYTVFQAQCVGMLPTNLHTKLLHTPSYSNLLVTTVKVKAKENFHTDIILLFYTL
jgi:hypothetical protein